MDSYIFWLYIAALILITLIYWAWRFKHSQGDLVKIVLPMTGSSDSLCRCQQGDITFFANGKVRFENYDQAFSDGTYMRYHEEFGLKAWRARGFGKILSIERPDHIVQRYQYIGSVWYQLSPCEQQPGIFKEAVRQIRQRGISGFITFPEDFANTVLAIPGFILIVVLRIATILFVLWMILVFIFPDLTAHTEQFAIPVFTPN